jgi:hypothetical protein
MAKKNNRKIAGFDIEELPDQYARITEQRKNTLLGQELAIDMAYRRLAESDFISFIRGLRIASVFGPRLFDRCMASFQIDFFEDIAPSLHMLRDGDMPKKRRWWLERTKKGSKDADLAAIVMWLMAFPVRPFYIQIGAANREQAAIVKERMTHLIHYNSWLNDHVEIIQSTVRSKKLLADGQPMATLHIMSSDAAGGHGGTPDLLVINELSHIRKFEFAETMMDNADGVPQGMVIIATNAGFMNTPPHRWKTHAIKSAEWTVHQLAKPAPWHDNRTIEDARKRNSPSRFARLWKGQWVSASGDALSEEAVERAFCLDGPCMEREPGWDYIGGLDLGISHDHSGLAIIGVNYKKQLAKLVFMKRWKPPKGGDIYLPDVESECLAAAKNFGIQWLFYDPYQAKLMAQRLSKAGVMMREMTFSVPKNLSLMATSFMQILEAGKLKLYDDDEGSLRADFARMSIVEKSFGYKLDATSDETGHADVGTAMIIALPSVMEMLGIGNIYLNPDDILTDLDDSELSAEEVDAMPPELREIYKMDEADAQNARDGFDGVDDFVGFG